MQIMVILCLAEEAIKYLHYGNLALQLNGICGVLVTTLIDNV